MIQTPDVVIVGGGIFGAALAYEFGKRTIRTVLLESSAPGSGATGSSFGWINAVSKWDDPDYFRLNLAGMSTYETLASEYGEDALGLRGGGSLEIFSPGTDPESAARFGQKRDALQALGANVYPLSPGELACLEPELKLPPEILALFSPADRLLDPVEFTRFLLSEATTMRVAIREYEPVREIIHLPTTGTYTVNTETNSYSTPTLILAGGTATRSLFAMFDPALAERFVRLKRSLGLLLTVSNRDEAGRDLRRRVRRAVLFESGLRVRPATGDSLRVGSDTIDARLDLATEADYSGLIEQLLSDLKSVLPEKPANPSSGNLEMMLGQRVLPADDRPIVGGIPGLPGLFLALTHSGITLAPVLAQHLATEITNGAIQLPANYRPERFA